MRFEACYPGLCGTSVARIVFFFFQAEDGIRDLTVTGVQTCALPISLVRPLTLAALLGAGWNTPPAWPQAVAAVKAEAPLRGRAWQLANQAYAQDRKSTRLNSSHSQISYAVFCLKKKKHPPPRPRPPPP